MERAVADRLGDVRGLDLVVAESAELLQRVRRGVSLSRRIDLEHIERMEEQELLD